MDSDYFYSIFDRSRKLVGVDALEMLSKKRVLVFGLGGVGGYCVEALARSGVGNFTLVDKDVVDETNINRQIIATMETIGQEKTKVFEKRLLSINPGLSIDCRSIFYLPGMEGEFSFGEYDFVVDCVDTVSAKLSIVEEALKNEVNVISAMGCGNKTHPEMLVIEDIYKTKICPLAKTIRHECRKRKLQGFPVAYSVEQPIVNERPPASMMFVPAVAGIMMASYIVNNWINTQFE